MQPQGQHPLQNGFRSVGVNNSGLAGPGTKTGNVDSSFKSDCPILVPAHLPVGPGRLIKQQTADGEAFWTKHRLDQSPNRWGANQGRQRGQDRKQFPHSVDLALPAHLLTVRQLRQFVQQATDDNRCKSFRHNSKAVHCDAPAQIWSPFCWCWSLRLHCEFPQQR